MHKVVTRLLVMSAALVALAAFAATGQAALPPGIHCTPATAENRLTPPPPPWQLNHEPKPAHTPPPLCPSGMVPTTMPGVNGSASVTAAPPVELSPKGFHEGIEPQLVEEGYPKAPYYYSGDGFHTSEAWAGDSFGIQVGNPTLSAPAGTHSLGQVTSATPNVEYTAEIGWHRDEGFGSGSRLFVYINKDKYTSNGQPGGDCYNCITMQEGAPYTLNQELTVGTKYQFSLDYSSGSWWFGVGSTWIGHESGTFWSGKFTSATWLTAHGEVYDTTGPNSQMGNGTIGTTTGSLTMGNPVLYKPKGELFTTKGHATPAQNPYPSDLPAYNVGLYSANEREWHYGGT
jgi:hypothetical protein